MCFAVEFLNLWPNSRDVSLIFYEPYEFNWYTAPKVQSKPDWTSYNKSMESGLPHLMVRAAEVVLMVLKGQKFKELELAFVPMKTPEYSGLSF